MDAHATGSGVSADAAGRTVVILDIIAKETGVDRALLVPEARIEALEIQSLDMVQAIFELETRFDIQIPVLAEQGGGEFETVGALVRHVLRTIERTAPGHA